jgi:hypothetical protein
MAKCANWQCPVKKIAAKRQVRTEIKLLEIKAQGLAGIGGL